MEELLEPILRQMRINRITPHIFNNTTLCDIGCGTNAYFINSIACKLESVVGIDKCVNNSEYKNLILLKSELQKTIPLFDDTFDYVTLLAVLEHLEYPNEIISEAYRILKPNGKVIITTPSPTSKHILEFLSYKLHIVSVKEIKEHKNYYNLKELNEMLIKNSFTIERSNTFQFGLNNFVIAIK